MPRGDDDVDVLHRFKYETELPAVDFDNSEAKAMQDAQETWRPIHERLKMECDSEPDLSKRAVLAKLLMDVAMASKTPAVVGKQIAQLCKIYGHESTTVRHEDATGGLEKRLDEWIRQAKQRQLPKQEDSVVITVKPEVKEVAGGDF